MTTNEEDQPPPLPTDQSSFNALMWYRVAKVEREMGGLRGDVRDILSILQQAQGARAFAHVAWAFGVGVAGVVGFFVDHVWRHGV